MKKQLALFFHKNFFFFSFFFFKNTSKLNIKKIWWLIDNNFYKKINYIIIKIHQLLKIKKHIRKYILYILYIIRNMFLHRKLFSMQKHKNIKINLNLINSSKIINNTITKIKFIQFFNIYDKYYKKTKIKINL
jgi:hypothetical protein